MEIRKMTTEEKGVQAALTRTLAIAADQYYNNGQASMTDLEYDRAYERLKKLEQENGFSYDISPTQKVGAPVKVETLQQVTHEYPALSLDKVKYADRENLVAWLKDKEGVLSWKCDGLTIVATYQNGKLVQAATRGNGEIGNEVTHNAKFFKGLPEKIPYQGKLVIRGEALMSFAEFDRINAETDGLYENPRNLCTATVQMLDAAESSKREIQFHAFKMVYPTAEENLKTETERFTFLQEQGIRVVEYESVNAGNILKKIEEWKEKMKKNPVPTDGLVLSYDNQVYAGSLGNTNKHPRGSMAMKWTDETVETELTDVEWSIGKTGVITPVAIFKPVRLGAGSTVTRASMHNISIMEHMPEKEGNQGTMQIGSIVEVGLANMIIPQVYSQRNGNPEKMHPIHVPETCPVCGIKTDILVNNGIKTLRCPNADCAARTRGMLENAFGRSGLNIKGLGPSQIEDLQQAKLITKYPVEVYTLKELTGGKMPEKLAAKDGWGEKSWQNLLDAIDKSRDTTLQRFLYSLGVPLLGNDLSKKLSAHWDGDIAKFDYYYKNPDSENLADLDGVGAIKAGNLYDWCRFTKSNSVKNLMFRRLIEELYFEMPKKTASDNSLAGMTFVITGAVHEYKNRDEFKASVEARGGKVSGSVSSKAILVNNDLESMSGKNKKARELGIPVISEDEFITKYGK